MYEIWYLFTKKCCFLIIFTLEILRKLVYYLLVKLMRTLVPLQEVYIMDIKNALIQTIIELLKECDDQELLTLIKSLLTVGS